MKVLKKIAAIIQTEPSSLQSALVNWAVIPRPYSGQLNIIIFLNFKLLNLYAYLQEKTNSVKLSESSFNNIASQCVNKNPSWPLIHNLKSIKFTHVY